jgi:hypothetical protein
MTASLSGFNRFTNELWKVPTRRIYLNYKLLGDTVHWESWTEAIIYKTMASQQFLFHLVLLFVR